MVDHSIALLFRGEQANDAEKALQEQLGLQGLRTIDASQAGVSFFLRFDDRGLALYSNSPDGPGALRVDFSSRALNRRAIDSLPKQNLGKAIGLKGNKRAVVLDATAGLGTDSFLLASAGCSVYMLERNAIVHALLNDGLRRGLQTDSPVLEIVQRMHLQQGDFLDVTAANSSSSMVPADIDVVFLDPMFPERSKSARAKKSMFLLQQLLGHDEDKAELLERALELAGKRVVVKRAKLSPVMPGRDPDVSFKGSSNRYDVYLKT